MKKPLLSWFLITAGCVLLATLSCRGVIEDGLEGAAVTTYSGLGDDYNDVHFEAEGLNFTLTGEVPTEDVRENAARIASDSVFPWGADAVNNQLKISSPEPIVIPPRHYDVTVDYNNGVVLKGELPSVETQVALNEAAKRAFRDTTIITDKTVVVKGVPFPNLERVLVGIPASVAQFETGNGSLLNGTVNITGTAKNKRVKNEIESSYEPVDGYPHTIEVTFNKEFVVLDKCQTAFDDLLGRNNIQFKTGSAAISKKSFALLDQLAALAKTCPAAEIEVSGHTDNKGSDKSNQKLSEARAKSVVQFLNRRDVKKGVAYAGYGESKPKATNETEEGRRQNRRIEFTIKGVK